MPEIVGLLTENEQPIVRKVFRTLQRRLREQNGLSLGYLWRSTLRDCRAQVGLGTQECDILCDAANYLGRYDADEQLTGLSQVERRLAALQSAPPAGRRTYIIKDVRLFLNSVDRGLRLIRDAGVDAKTERQETEDEIVLTLHIPKQRRKEA